MSARDCAVCGWSSRDGTELPGWCPRCRGRTIADVADLPELWRTLARLLQPGSTGEQQRVAGSRTAPLPLRVEAANLRGPAGVGVIHARDQGGALSLATTVWIIRQAIRECCDLPAEMTGPRRRDVEAGVVADSRFLLAWLDRYAERAAPDELAGVVGDLHHARRRAWNACGYQAHKIRLGPCPKDVAEGLVCGNELWIDPVTDEEVTCRDCGTTWDRRYFLWLRRITIEGEGA